MYKKIKNSNFMNLIWFIICIAPILLIFIYSIAFINNEDLHYEQYETTIESIEGNTQKTIINNLDTTSANKNVLIIEGMQNENGTIKSVQIENSTLHKLNLELYLYDGLRDYVDNYLYFYINKPITSSSTINNFSIYITKNDNTIIEKSLKSIFYSFNVNNYYDKDIVLAFNLNELINGENLSKNDIRNIGGVFNLNGLSEETQLNLIITNEIQLFSKKEIEKILYYTNDINQLKINSTPIKYNFNNEVFEIETNNNNYLGTNETIEINKKFITNTTINNYDLLYDNFNTLKEFKIISQIQGQTEYNPNLIYYNRISNNYAIRYTELSTSSLNNLKNNFDTYKNQYYLPIYEEPIEAQIITSGTYPFNYTSFEAYLLNLNNTIQTNGFISNAFLNLSQYFGVTNIYYSLACYYIEYLLVIILLHLAFDILYMLPNICHKFMEKLGGERD